MSPPLARMPSTRGMRSRRPPAATPPAPRLQALLSALTALAGTLLLLAPALWNRFPFVFYDTAPYLELAFAPRFLPQRPIFYGLFLRAAGVGLSAWLVAAAQSLLALWLLAELQRALLGRLSRRLFLALIAALSIATSLPWFTGQLMPDIFGPLAVIAIYLLAFHARALDLPRRVALAAVVWAALLVHASHVALAVGLVAALALARWLIPGPQPRPQLGLPAGAVAAALATLGLANFAFTGQWFLNRSGSSFLAARMIGDGLVQELLDETCPASGYRLCPFRGQLPRDADEWLWEEKSPFQQLGAFEGMAEESSRLVAGVLRRHPLESVRAAARSTWTQWGYLRTGGDSLEVREGSGLRRGGIQRMIDEVEPVLARRIPAQRSAYLEAREQQRELPFARINGLHVRVAHLSLLGLALLLVHCARRRRWLELQLLWVVLAALAGNAFICGAISGPQNRYQTRVIWLAPLAVALVLARLRQRGSER